MPEKPRPVSKKRPAKPLTGKNALVARVRAKKAASIKNKVKGIKLMGAGFAVAGFGSEYAGILISATGLVPAAHGVITHAAIEKRLLRKPRTAAMLARRFTGTGWEKYFKDLAKAAAKRAKKRKQKAREKTP